MTPPNRRYTDSFTPTKSLKLSSINSLRDYYALPANDQKTISEDYKPTQPNSLSGHHRKSKSEANGFSKISKTNNVKIPIANDKSIEKSVRRRKSDVDQDSASQPKLVNPTAPESEPFTPDSIPLTGVRKSSSAPVFLQSETAIDNSSPTPSSIWPISMLNFTADFQAMSTILFDGLPKPRSDRKKKAARD